MRNIKIYMIILPVFFLLPFQLVQSNENIDTESLIKAYIESRQDPNQKPLKYITDEQLKDANPQKLLTLLANYDSNESYTVRRLALSFEVNIAKIYPTADIRQEVAQRLVRDLVDPNSNTSSRSYEWLLSFTKDDFNESSKGLLHKALAENMPDSRVMKICGVADMKDELPRLKELITISEIKYNNEDPIMRKIIPWYQRKGWAARLARARMGVKEDIIRCIDLAESEADVNVRVQRILPGIGYMRQPEAIEYLKKYLESDGRIPFPGQSYASRAVHILAVSLSNFPIKQKETRSYTDEEISVSRKWMSEQKEWQIIK